MVSNVKSALVAGAIAFVIYTVIAVLTGAGFGAAVGVGLLFLIGTALVTFLITLVVDAVRKNKTPA
jgi:hypothetical protein